MPKVLFSRCRSYFIKSLFQLLKIGISKAGKASCSFTLKVLVNHVKLQLTHTYVYADREIKQYVN